MRKKSENSDICSAEVFSVVHKDVNSIDQHNITKVRVEGIDTNIIENESDFVNQHTLYYFAL